jgi:hypothetical protein
MQEINQANDYLCGKFNGHNLFGNHDNANVNETDLTKSRNSETN